jgi:HSP20 family protein
MATLQWDPWRELSTFERQMNDLFSRVQRQPSGRVGFAPVLDAFHRDGALVVRVELPGIKPEDVQIELSDNVLVIRGERQHEGLVEDASWVRRERSYGAFERQIVLPDGTDPDSIAAHFDLGVLEVTIPHPRAVEPRKVQIQVGAPTNGTAASIDTTSAEAGVGASN